MNCFLQLQVVKSIKIQTGCSETYFRNFAFEFYNTSKENVKCENAKQECISSD